MSALSGVGTSSGVEDCDVARPPSEMVFGVTLDRFLAEHFTAVRARATGALRTRLQVVLGPDTVA